MSTPAPSPAAVVIRLVREASGIRLADAASKAGVSVARWSQIENGHETRQGEVRPAKAKSSTIARMAAAVGVPADRMEAEGHDPEAAAIMREIERQSPPLQVAVDFAREMGVDPDDPADPFARAVRREIGNAKDVYGESPTGIQVFRGQPESEIEAMIWDDAGLSEDSKIRAIAGLRADRARRRAARDHFGRNSGTAGLVLVTSARGP